MPSLLFQELLPGVPVTNDDKARDTTRLPTIPLYPACDPPFSIKLLRPIVELNSSFDSLADRGSLDLASYQGWYISRNSLFTPC